MIRFDAETQRWVDPEADRLRAQQHEDSARQQHQVLKGGFAVLAVCGLLFGTWALGWKDEPEPPRTQPQPTATATGTAAPSDDPQPVPDDGPGGESPSAGAPPGYERIQDPEGFTIAVPDGWNRRTEGRDTGSQVVIYEGDGGDRQLQIFWVEDDAPYESLKLAEKNAERNKDYDRKALDRLDGGDGPAARLEYTYDSDDHGGTRHVIDHRFEAEDGELYAIIAYGQGDGDSGGGGGGDDGGGDGAQDAEQELLETALAAFCPSGTECPAGGDSTSPVE